MSVCVCICDVHVGVCMLAFMSECVCEFVHMGV